MQTSEAFAKPLCNGTAPATQARGESFDLVYTYDAERDIVFIEAPIRQRTAW